jgi:hypothetical protein
MRRASTADICGWATWTRVSTRGSCGTSSRAWARSNQSPASRRTPSSTLCRSGPRRRPTSTSRFGFHIPHMPTRGSHTWAPFRFLLTLFTVSRATCTTLQGLRLGSQCVMLDYARSDSVKERQRKENTKATGRPDRHRVRMRCDLRESFVCVSRACRVSCVRECVRLT